LAVQASPARSTHSHGMRRQPGGGIVVTAWHALAICYTIGASLPYSSADAPAILEDPTSRLVDTARGVQVHSDMVQWERPTGGASAVPAASGSALLRRELGIGVGATAASDTADGVLDTSRMPGPRPATDGIRYVLPPRPLPSNRGGGSEHGRRQVLLGGAGQLEPSVWCGAHAAPDCSSCTVGHGAAWCNGLCRWNETYHICQDVPSSDGIPQRRAGHHVVVEPLREEKEDQAEASEAAELTHVEDINKLRYRFFTACCACMTLGFFLAIVAVAIYILWEKLRRTRKFNTLAEKALGETQSQGPSGLGYQPQMGYQTQKGGKGEKGQKGQRGPQTS